MNDQLRPKKGEFVPFFAAYINRVIGQDIPKAEVSVRALFHIIAGHTDHHLSILRERY